MADIGSTLSKYTSASELSNLLESDKAGIYFAKTYLALDGVTDDYDDLYALINTTINGADAEIWIKDGSALINSNISTPSNIKLKFLNGGMLKPANGVTITGSDTKIEAGLHQIFDLSLGGILAGTWRVKKTYPEWFGAVVDGVTDDDLPFEKSVNFALLSGLKLQLPKGKMKLSTGNISLTRPIKIIGHGESDGSTSQTYIDYSGTGALFKIDVPVGVQWRGFEFSGFKFYSAVGKGGFIDVNKGNTMLESPATQPCGLLVKPTFEKIVFSKQYTNTTPVTLDGIYGIDGVAIMNGLFDHCYFTGWDIALNLPQCDLNLFNHCLFTENVQIANLTEQNTFGSQTLFQHCDFESRRDGCTSYYTIVDKARDTVFNDCYFETVDLQTKGWFDFDGGRNHQLISCRFDMLPAHFETAFCNITQLSLGVIFDKCHAVSFNTDTSKNALIETKFNGGFFPQSQKGCSLLYCSPQFTSFFDLTNSNIIHVSVVSSSLQMSEKDTSPKRVTYNVHNYIENANSFYTTMQDALSSTGHVFEITRTTDLGVGDTLQFNLIVDNSIIRTGRMYKIKVKARGTNSAQTTKMRFTINRVSAVGDYISTIGRNYASLSHDEYTDVVSFIKETGDDPDVSLPTEWQSGEYVQFVIKAYDGAGTDGATVAVLVDSVEIEEIQDYMYLSGDNGSMYVLDINTSTDGLRVTKKTSSAEVYPNQTY